MHEIISDSYTHLKSKILPIFQHFDSKGTLFVEGKRNSIKIFEIDDLLINVKRFKKPNFINKIVYRYFRKSKAQRSFEFASKLKEFQIGTPEPIAYQENFDVLGLSDSFYACKHLQHVFEFREVIQNESMENREIIIRKFTQFTFEMHQKGIEFLDHSPGNTLIKVNNDKSYSFFLVDLNRMKFHDTLDFKTRMKNLSKITHKEDMIVIMSNEYAKLMKINEEEVFQTLWGYTQKFQYKFHRKKRIKKQLKFWKK